MKKWLFLGITILFPWILVGQGTWHKFRIGGMEVAFPSEDVRFETVHTPEYHVEMALCETAAGVYYAKSLQMFEPLEEEAFNDGALLILNALLDQDREELGLEWAAPPEESSTTFRRRPYVTMVGQGEKGPFGAELHGWIGRTHTFILGVVYENQKPSQMDLDPFWLGFSPKGK